MVNIPNLGGMVNIPNLGGVVSIPSIGGMVNIPYLSWGGLEARVKLLSVSTQCKFELRMSLLATLLVWLLIHNCLHHDLLIMIN